MLAWNPSNSDAICIDRTVVERCPYYPIKNTSSSDVLLMYYIVHFCDAALISMTTVYIISHYICTLGP